MKRDDAGIRKFFNNNVTVHVCATKQLADETIINAATDDINTYIVSNDRYADFC